LGRPLHGHHFNVRRHSLGFTNIRLNLVISVTCYIRQFTTIRDHLLAAGQFVGIFVDISRNLIRIWVRKFEAGAFDDDAQAADLLQDYEAKIAALERLVGRQALEIE
jgi:hypothetical protein